MKSFLYTKLKISKLMKLLAVLGLAIFSTNTSFAQSSTDALGSLASNDMFLWFILIAVILLNLMAVVLLIVVLKIQQILFAKDTDTEEEPSLFGSLSSKLTDAVPVEKEEDILLDHDYDGIQELDNNLPPWWKYMFYLTIVFAFIYIGVYHVFDLAPLQDEEYTQDVARAEAEVAEYIANMANAVDETNVELLDDEARIASGEEIFMKNCAVCHGKLGEGGVGPNFTDNYWIHGGDIKDLFKTIKYGVPSKGMISWQAQLSPGQMQEVGSYILTLVGTNPPNGKDPQGELYEPAGE
ncbi:cbb3-type cytochrome c oxidase N-terminal domain-containing protein [Flammeovirgaceae bacterium SG7u.111]|nr:cbb3-type cytochrome c oxidase N-terminal domain-containing protein [Flammeovirgaceae bacterium SG7u.132]WPO35617.1 cbb3-type cytochrome c oxidase N-terminal domain-containing protein [Flammeovirgaceae bacterium SG7u.111]